MGHDGQDNVATVVIAESQLAIPNFKGLSGAYMMDIVLNRSLRTIKMDEVMIDPTVKINIQAVLARNIERIPWAAIDYTLEPFVLDIKNPDNVYTNLIRSAYTQGVGWVCKLPDGRQLEWLGDGQPVIARRWR